MGYPDVSSMVKYKKLKRLLVKIYLYQNYKIYTLNLKL